MKFTLLGLVALSATAAAQSHGKPDVRTELRAAQDVEYRLFEATVDGMPLAPGSTPEVSIKFHSDGQVSGRSGASRYFSGAKIESDGALRWDPAEFAVTRDSGQPDISSFGARYLTALAATRRIRLERGEITLSSADGRTVLRFRPVLWNVMIAQLRGVELKLIRMVVDGKEVAGVQNSSITLTFADDTKFNGRGPVNLYSGRLNEQARGKVGALLQPVNSTLMGASPELMNLESAYFDALAAVDQAKVFTSGLTLENPERKITLEYRAN